MAKSKPVSIQFASIDELFLDPLNPRLGRAHAASNLKQSEILDLMSDWSLEELGVSFLENGYWPQEAVVTTRERLYGRECLVVIEGNRRLAALKLLRTASNGGKSSAKWTEIANSEAIPDELFNRVPYIEVDDRDSVEAFLGFRHVTGIKEWRPAEKAEFIARLIEKNGMSYEEVMRKIGSKTTAVRQNYIAYRLLIQMEETGDVAIRDVENKFSVLSLSLRTQGVRSYLGIDVTSDPKSARYPVSSRQVRKLERFALWLFGNQEKEISALISDSRDIEKFGKILESDKAIEYLESSRHPVFEVAYREAGGDEPQIIDLVLTAATSIESALARVHLYKKSKKVIEAIDRLARDSHQILEIFPEIQQPVFFQEDAE